MAEIGYQARSKARAAAIRAALLPILQQHEAEDTLPDYAALSLRLGCSISGLRNYATEFGRLGLITPPEVLRVRRQSLRAVTNLAERVAKVRAAKLAVREREGRMSLTDDELTAVLPD